MKVSPLTEYIVGVLAPILSQQPRDVDGDTELPSSDVEGYEEGDLDVDIESPIMTAPALSPKNRPSSMGISFATESDGPPTMDVCLTWARYFFNEKAKVWERRPRGNVVHLEAKDGLIKFFDANGREVAEPDAEISLSTVVRTGEGKATSLISLFLTNRLRAKEPDG